MGNVILPSGATTWVEELQGSINLSELINDMQQKEYTPSYRISVISALSKLGKKAECAVSYLRELVDDSTCDINISEAARHALQKIKSDTSVSHDNRHYKFGGGTNSVNHGSSSYTPPAKKLQVYEVEFSEVGDSEELHSGLSHYCACYFCDKVVKVNDNIRYFSDCLTDNYYCSFCLSNDNHLRFGKSTLVLTYRGLIGYYYYAYYVTPKSPSMFVSDIEDYIALHRRVGLQNPVFRYDPESYNWFLDFTKVGKRKIPIEYVLQTIIEQLACFNIYENVPGVSPRKMYEKYRDVVLEFNQNRAKTNGKVFAPTLWGCGTPDRCPSGTRAIPVKALQRFAPVSLTNDNYNTRANIRKSDFGE